MQLRSNNRGLVKSLVYSVKISLAASAVLASLVLSALPSTAYAQGGNPEKEFIMSCTYGVLAGTLVGAASLAFVDKPGDNLQRVARGASLGLYAGIALGYYTVYYLPKQLEQREEDRLNPDNVYNRSIKNLEKTEVAVFPSVAMDAESHLSAPALGLTLNF